MLFRYATNLLCLRTFGQGRVLLKSGPQFKPLPELNEADLEETFIRGTGPGGQKINKTSVVAQLKHIPTGLTIKCQATRSQAQNRVIARKQLRQKLDDLLLGNDSRSAIKKDISKKKAMSAQKKRNRKYRSLQTQETPTSEDEQEEEK